MSRKLVIPGAAFTGPQLKNDDLEISGSLLLVEPAHPANPWATGVPSDGATIPNVVASRAATTLGVPAASTQAAFANTGLSGSKGLLERTTKGGLHGITSPTVSVQNQGARVLFPAAFKTYLLANMTHNFYYSLWGKHTRVASATIPSTLGVGIADGNAHTFFYKGDIRPPAPSQTSGPRVNVVGNTQGSVVGNEFTAAEVKGWWNTAAPSSISAFDAAVSWGPIGLINSSSVQGTPSFVLYRVYIEDLTVSGRTFATVSALDQAMWNDAFIASGGRYNGDTHTAASAVA